MSDALKTDLECESCGERSIIVTLKDKPKPLFCPCCGEPIVEKEDE